MSLFDAFNAQITGTIASTQFISFKGRDGKDVAYREIVIIIENQLAVFRTTEAEADEWTVGQKLDLSASLSGQAKVNLPRLKVSSARPADKS